MILNKASWDLYINTPSESADIIFNEFLPYINSKDKESVQELIKTWMQFSLLEYSVYKKYDQTIITFASFYIGLSQHDNISKGLFDLFLAFIENSHVVSLSEVKQCSESIMNLLQVSEECKMEAYDDLTLSPKFTRANSLYSLGEIFTQYEQSSLLQLEKEESSSLFSIQSTFDSDSNFAFAEEKAPITFLSRKRKASVTIE